MYGTFDPGIFAYLTNEGEMIEAKHGFPDLCLAAFSTVLLVVLCQLLK